AVGSFHLYDWAEPRVQRYLDEGFQSTLAPMPPMPIHDPKWALAALLDAEQALRLSPPDCARATQYEKTLEAYWADIIRILLGYRHWKDDNPDNVLRVRDSMASPI